MSSKTVDAQDIEGTLNEILSELQVTYPTLTGEQYDLGVNTVRRLRLDDSELRRIMGDAYPSDSREFGHFVDITIQPSENGYTINERYHFGSVRLLVHSEENGEQLNSNRRFGVMVTAQKFAESNGFDIKHTEGVPYTSSRVYPKDTSIDTLEQAKEVVIGNVVKYMDHCKANFTPTG